MKFQFDPNQQYQLDAILAVTDLFKGQQIAGYAEFGAVGGRIASLKELSSSKAGYEMGYYGNTLTLTDEQINKNLRIVQEKSAVDRNSVPSLDRDSRLHGNDGINPPSPPCQGGKQIPPYQGGTQETHEQGGTQSPLDKGKNFTVEMETGTGKTYIYLRTIFELNKQYSFNKFIIVVPSIAIREGVLKSLEVMTSHFKDLYNKVPFSQFVYQSKKVSLLRNFARGNDLQIMIINIDAFNKDKNIIHSPRDQMGGLKPIEFIQHTNPIVIIDEPQNMESEKSKLAIKSLNPLFVLRYSATHRNLYNLVYRLDPVKAFQKKLVKKISVAAVVQENDPTKAYIRVIKITNKNNKITCTLSFFKNTKEERKLTQRVCKQHDDLFVLSKENPIYKNGFKISEINCKPGQEFVQFTNGIKMHLGEEQGGYREEVVKTQIRETIRAHLEKEKQLKGLGIKVLSLFFLDKVQNYRIYHADKNKTGNNNQTMSNNQIDKNSLGLYGKWFEEIYKEVSKKYAKQINIIPADKVHGGYFSKDHKGTIKDTKGNTKEDYNTYNLIMKDKEKLLDINNNLKFIFSHSALREGWDNPNIFQICTLNETQSNIKKRQEIGRGLRLPVNQKGERVQDDLINNLVVVANENYNDFVQSLQKEMEEDLGINFNKNYIQKHKTKVKAGLNKNTLLDPEFKKFWDTIAKKTFYNVNYSTKALIKKAGTAIQKMPAIGPINITVQTADIKVSAKGIGATLTKTPTKHFLPQRTIIPDILSHIEERIKITKKTIFDILKTANRWQDFINNPQKFMDSSLQIIQDVLQGLIIEGIKYEKLTMDGRDSRLHGNDGVHGKGDVHEDDGVHGNDNVQYEMSRFEREEQKMEFVNDKIIPTTKSVYDYIYYESNPEKQFATTLENMQNIKYFIKLPHWFKVPTPVGDYNPDWAILKQNGDIVYMIRETKANLKEGALRGLEKSKIKCGNKHFESIGVNYKVCTADIRSADL